MAGNGKAVGRVAQDITIDETNSPLPAFSILFRNETYEIGSVSSFQRYLINISFKRNVRFRAGGLSGCFVIRAESKATSPFENAGSDVRKRL